MRTIVIACLTLMFGAMPAQAADEPTPPAQDKSTESPQRKTDCLHETGSRIHRPKGDCISYPGRSYDNEQIRQTGANDAGQALRQLDPSLTVGR